MSIDGLQARIRAGHIAPNERHVLAELVADVADNVSPGLVGADAWLRDVIHARYTKLLQTGDGKLRTGLGQ